MRIPFLDLSAQYLSIKNKINEAIETVCDSQLFILGPYLENFEQEMTKYLKTGYAVGVGSGTDALLLSLMAIELKKGDCVITTPFTFFATAGSISRLGGLPVFVDIDPLTYQINPKKIEETIIRMSDNKARLKAIIPVHLYGQCADMSPIMEISRRYGLTVIEDAAQAIGAEYIVKTAATTDQAEKEPVTINKQEKKKAGTMGDFGCFSFFPSKNLGGFGDGGMIVTNNSKLAKRSSVLRIHGSTQKYYHEVIGCNSRLDSIQAAVLSVKLKYLDGWIKARQAKAKHYNKLFIEMGLSREQSGQYPNEEAIILPHIGDNTSHTFNYYVIRTKERDLLSEYLLKEGVGTQIYYPLPLHRQECYAHLGYKEGDFPEAERAAGETLALPIYPELSENMQEHVVKKIGKFFKKKDNRHG